MWLFCCCLVFVEIVEWIVASLLAFDVGMSGHRRYFSEMVGFVHVADEWTTSRILNDGETDCLTSDVGRAYGLPAVYWTV